jgi:hypothetical protein
VGNILGQIGFSIIVKRRLCADRIQLSHDGSLWRAAVCMAMWLRVV